MIPDPGVNWTDMVDTAVGAFVGVVVPVSALCWKMYRWFDRVGDDVASLVKVVGKSRQQIDALEHRVTTLEARDS